MSFEPVFDRYRERLLRMVDLRLSPRLRARVGASDIVQETCIEAWRQLEARDLPGATEPYLWLRRIAEQKLIQAYRRHLGAQKRGADVEVSLQQPRPAVESELLAESMVSAGSTPSETLARSELFSRVVEALETLDPIDREILALRHFEDLSNAEVCQVLSLAPSAASKRYQRALGRLRVLVEAAGDDRNV